VCVCWVHIEPQAGEPHLANLNLSNQLFIH
jgi:hypothetical protein